MSRNNPAFHLKHVIHIVMRHIANTWIGIPNLETEFWQKNIIFHFKQISNMQDLLKHGRVVFK